MKSTSKVKPPTYADLEAMERPSLQDFIAYLQSIPANKWITDSTNNQEDNTWFHEMRKINPKVKKSTVLKCCVVGWLGWCCKPVNKRYAKNPSWCVNHYQGLIPKLKLCGIDHDKLVHINNATGQGNIVERSKGIKKRVIEYLKSHLPKTPTNLGTIPAKE